MSTSTYTSNWQSLNIFQSCFPNSFVGFQRNAGITSKCFYAAMQAELLVILRQHFGKQGRVYPEWTLKLRCNERDWFPVPALTYISYEKLDANWMLDEFCPIAPDLIVEIVGKNQRLDRIVEKVDDYLESGVTRVYLVNPYSQSITISAHNQATQTFTGEMIIDNQIFANLNLTAKNIFEQAGFS